MKFTDYPSVQSLFENNIFLLDGPDGTKQITAKDLSDAIAKMAGLSEVVDYYDLLDNQAPMEVRRNTFRGKSLGEEFTKEQAQRIVDGSFKGFFVGDYWEINEHTWRIVDINYWIGTGDEYNECTTPHLVIMPDHILYNQRMNATNTTKTGYVGSEMYTSGLNQAKVTVNNAFGSENILNHREYLVNSVSNSSASGDWYDSTIELPNERMMCGSNVYAMYIALGSSDANTNFTTIDDSELALMQIHPKYINPYRENQWLRDADSELRFSLMSGLGYITHGGASYTGCGVRPVFGITGEALAAS